MLDEVLRYCRLLSLYSLLYEKNTFVTEPNVLELLTDI